MADALKDKGNALYKQQDYLQAAAAYTQAIKADPGNVVLYSNRSAALLRLNKVAKAQQDAEACLRLDPTWPKGWVRKGAVLEQQGQLAEALQCYRQAHALAADGADYEVKVRALAAEVRRSSKLGQAKARLSPAEAAALQFVEAKLAYAVELAQSHGSSFAPELHFLHPDQQQQQQQQQPDAEAPGDAGGKQQAETAVRAAHAFASPPMWEAFVTGMREEAQQRQAAAAVLIAPRAAVAFPQNWLQPGWPFQRERDGVFVQLQALVPAAAAQAAADASSAAPAQPAADATCVLRAAGSKCSSRKGDKQGAVSNSGSSAGGGCTVINKLYFIRMRDDKPPMAPEEVDDKFALLPTILRSSG